jgi:hypothetical protein
MLTVVDLIEVFGGEQPGEISQGEMHWFLDSLFRGLFKVLLKKGEKVPKNPNRRFVLCGIMNDKWV